MNRASVVWALWAALALASADDAGALPPGPSTAPRPAPLGFEVLALSDRGPELILAQRVIEREWTATEDSVVRLMLPGSKSEGTALALSAILPGAGQVYVGERSGYLFALAEAAGWVGWWLLRKDAGDLRDEAEVLVGSPADTASAWSFDRWADESGRDPTELMALYHGDREAFYDAIAADDQYASGWRAVSARDQFGSLRDRSDARYRNSRNVEVAVWLNHAVAAVDALRAARFHNLPFRRGLELRTRASWHGRGPALALSVLRRF